jgi:hypothetical protein
MHPRASSLGAGPTQARFPLQGKKSPPCYAWGKKNHLDARAGRPLNDHTCTTNRNDHTCTTNQFPLHHESTISKVLNSRTRSEVATKPVAY